MRHAAGGIVDRPWERLVGKSESRCAWPLHAASGGRGANQRLHQNRGKSAQVGASRRGWRDPGKQCKSARASPGALAQYQCWLPPEASLRGPAPRWRCDKGERGIQSKVARLVRAESRLTGPIKALGGSSEPLGLPGNAPGRAARVNRRASQGLRAKPAMSAIGVLNRFARFMRSRVPLRLP